MSEYIGTIIVAAIVLLIVFFIVKGMVNDRKKGTYVVATVPSVMADAVTVSKYQIVGFNNEGVRHCNRWRTPFVQ